MIEDDRHRLVEQCGGALGLVLQVLLEVAPSNRNEDKESLSVLDSIPRPHSDSELPWRSRTA